MEQKIEKLNKQARGYYKEPLEEFPVSFIPHRSGTYRIEIDAAIQSIAQFSTAIQILENAKEQDEVVILLQTPGGCVDSTDAFIHAIRKCNAPIHMIAAGGVHSAGSHILLEADSFELSAGFNALIHCGSDGAYGNVNEYRKKAEFDEKFRTKQFKSTYEGFLTESEMDDVLNGKDIWLDGQEWCDRATKRHEYFQNKIDAAQAEQEEATKPKRKRNTKKKAVDIEQEAV